MTLLNRIIILYLFLLLIGCQHSKSEKFVNKPIELQNSWQFRGHVGETIDRIAQERIIGQEQWKIIYPETEEAFKQKEDDSAYPKFGAWRGEFWGKYMLSVIAAARYYQSDELIERIKKSTYSFISLMDENGYLGTYKKTDFLEGNNWNIWGRKYTLWGLVESYQITSEKAFLDAAEKFTNHLFTEVGPGQFDIIKTGNFYGMPSTSILQPMVKLYNETGNQRYLDFAEYIVEQWSQHPEGLPDILNMGLSGKPVHLWFLNTDPMKWAKGYEFTSCVEGLLELYKVTKNEKYFTAAKNIHEVLVEFERTPIGSVSFNDKYIGSTGIINTVAEVCDAVYWNRLSFELYQLTGNVKYIDEMERTLYNSLLASFNPEGDWCLRRLRTSHIHIPAQNHFLHHHQCCTDNLPRGLFQAAEFAVTTKNDTLFVNLFNEGEGTVEVKSKKANGKSQQIKVAINGSFLDSSKVLLKLDTEKEADFVLAVRKPYWSKKTNIRSQDSLLIAEVTNGYLCLDKNWNSENQIEISFDMDIRWETFEPEKFDDTFHNIEFYNKYWAQMKFIGSTYEPNKIKYQHVDTLSVNQAIPQKEAVLFFYGPVALSRDIRISENDIFDRIPIPEKGKTLIKPVTATQDFWKLFEIDFGNGKKEIFCDFSSAGNTWSEQSEFNTWCLVEN
ncbi:glycoside hydrolase family 127 protein [Draconibacterium sp.]|nr:glycoside hydrolase family 127 protein [Draconibacterium sp.]